jgi:hypothetical protein
MEIFVNRIPEKDPRIVEMLNDPGYADRARERHLDQAAAWVRNEVDRRVQRELATPTTTWRRFVDSLAGVVGRRRANNPG